MPNTTAALRDRVQVELVRSLFATTTPTLIMSVGFVGSASLICWRFPDPILTRLAAAGGVASIVRVATVYRLLHRARAADLAAGGARVLERCFATCYLAFAAELGLFGARALVSSAPSAQMLALCLIVGYAAGVAAGAGLRPGSRSRA